MFYCLIANLLIVVLSHFLFAFSFPGNVGTHISNSIRNPFRVLIVINLEKIYRISSSSLL
jgi:hypothetical protein